MWPGLSRGCRWRAPKGSNLRLPGPEPGALSAELGAQNGMATLYPAELMRLGLPSAYVSFDAPLLVSTGDGSKPHAGLEPATFA